jgi:hypothetical protein
MKYVQVLKLYIAYSCRLPTSANTKSNSEPHFVTREPHKRGVKFLEPFSGHTQRINEMYQNRYCMVYVQFRVESRVKLKSVYVIIYFNALVE